MVGESNAGKSTISGSLDLVLSPDRLRRSPDINEHHFHYGRDLEPEVGNRASEVSQYVFRAYPMLPSPLYSVH